VGWALTGAKADERETFATIADAATPALARARGRRQITIADKNHYGGVFAPNPAAAGIELLA